jgi:hypothetical protein
MFGLSIFLLKLDFTILRLLHQSNVTQDKLEKQDLGFSVLGK